MVAQFFWQIVRVPLFNAEMELYEEEKGEVTAIDTAGDVTEEDERASAMAENIEKQVQKLRELVGGSASEPVRRGGVVFVFGLSSSHLHTVTAQLMMSAQKKKKEDPKLGATTVLPFYCRSISNRTPYDQFLHGIKECRKTRKTASNDDDQQQQQQQLYESVDSAVQSVDFGVRETYAATVTAMQQTIMKSVLPAQYQ